MQKNGYHIKLIERYGVKQKEKNCAEAKKAECGDEIIINGEGSKRMSNSVMRKRKKKKEEGNGKGMSRRESEKFSSSIV